MDLAKQPDATAWEGGFDEVLEGEDAEGEEEQGRRNKTGDDDGYPQSVDIFSLQVLEGEDAEGEEEQERWKNADDDDGYAQSVDIFLLHAPRGIISDQAIDGVGMWINFFSNILSSIIWIWFRYDFIYGALSS